MECSDISQSQISQYLGKMKLEGILESYKEWKEVYYRIEDKKVLEVIKSLKKIFVK
jgi:DNA-binding transcriptional ArsR family regulator